MNIVNKKNKTAEVKAHTIKNHLWIFVNYLIDNPAFESQTKETLTTRHNIFGSKCELSQEFLKKVSKCGVVKNILSLADFNFIHSFWTSLLNIPSFLVEFITPIFKATHKNGRVLSFIPCLSMNHGENIWVDEHQHQLLSLD